VGRPRKREGESEAEYFLRLREFLYHKGYGLHKAHEIAQRIIDFEKHSGNKRNL
jgi:prolyl-tRNA synthetase